MNILSRLDEIIGTYQKSGVDVKPLEDFIDFLYEDKKTLKGRRKCNLMDEGYCIYVLGEECDGYDFLDECPIKLAGLWWCGENGELVNKESCEVCNADQDCGCCDSVHNGSAPYNCNECGRNKVETEHGTICLDPKLTPEEVAAEVERCNENPGEFFRC